MEKIKSSAKCDDLKENNALQKSGSTIVIIPGENEIFNSAANSISTVYCKDIPSQMADDVNTYTTMKVPNWLIEGHEPKNVDSGLNFMHDWTKKNQMNDSSCDNLQFRPEPSRIIDDKIMPHFSKKTPNWVIQGHAPIDFDHALTFMNQWSAKKARPKSHKAPKPSDCANQAGKSKSTTGGMGKNSTCYECERLKQRLSISKANPLSCDSRNSDSKPKFSQSGIYRKSSGYDCQPSGSKSTIRNPITCTFSHCKPIESKAKIREVSMRTPIPICECKPLDTEAAPQNTVDVESGARRVEASETKSKLPIPKKKGKSKKRKSKEPAHCEDDELNTELVVDKKNSSTLAEFTVYQGKSQIRKRAKAEDIKKMLSSILGIRIGEMYDVEIKSLTVENENDNANEKGNAIEKVKDNSCICPEDQLHDLNIKGGEVDFGGKKGKKKKSIETIAKERNSVPVDNKPETQLNASDYYSQTMPLPSQFTFSPPPIIQCCRCGRSNHAQNAVLRKFESLRSST